MKRLATILMVCMFVSTYAQDKTTDKTVDKNDKTTMTKDHDKMSHDKDHAKDMANANMSDKSTIVGVASTNDDFKTLTKAIKAADLVATLNAEGPYTVFAPTDAAFDKIDKEKLKNLLHPAAKADLKAVLTYHVIPGEISSTDLVAAINDNGGQYVATTVEGSELTFTLENDNVVIADENGGKSTIVMTDVEASNGVIHAIDTVVMPSLTKF